MEEESAEWSNDEIEELIGLVSQFEHLYVTTSSDKKCRNMTRASWETISVKLNISPELCRKKWKSLKDTYYSTKRRNQSKSGDPAKTKVKWEFFTLMSFLDKVPTEAIADSNLVGEDKTAGDEADTQSVIVETPKKRKLLKSPHKTPGKSPKKGGKQKDDKFEENVFSHIVKNDSEEMAFAQYVGKSLLKMNERSKTLAQLKITQILTEMKMAEEDQKSHNYPTGNLYQTPTAPMPKCILLPLPLPLHMGKSTMIRLLSTPTCDNWTI